MRNGFTLVELSIVLVVVGLLIGGVLVGQGLIESVKFNRTVGEIAQIRASIQQFKQKYRCLPGDCPANRFGGLQSCGDNSGSIGYRHGFCSENYQAWNQLSALGFLKWRNSFQNIAVVGTSGFTAGVNYPASALDKGRLAYGFNGDELPAYGVDRQLRIGGQGGGTIEVKRTGSLSPYQALVLDQKMDDGIANAGNVRTSKDSTNGYPEGCAPTNGAAYYTITTPSENCDLVVNDIHD